MNKPNLISVDLSIRSSYFLRSFVPALVFVYLLLGSGIKDFSNTTEHHILIKYCKAQNSRYATIAKWADIPGPWLGKHVPSATDMKATAQELCFPCCWAKIL
jgi:hypothetical protein